MSENKPRWKPSNALAIAAFVVFIFAMYQCVAGVRETQRATDRLFQSGEKP